MIVDPSFLTHWKTKLLCKRLKDPAAPLYVIALWGHCQTARKAELDIPREAIADVCGFTGDAEALIEALVECRFLDKDGDALRVHQWGEYNGKLVSNWENGRRGGRKVNPQGTHCEPTPNPQETQNGIGLTQTEPTANPLKTHAEPTQNPQGTHDEPIRLDRSREDGEEPEPPIAPRGGGDGLGDGILNVQAEEEAKARAAAEAAAEKERKQSVAKRIGELFGRRSRWTEREVASFSKRWPISEEDLGLIETYYTAQIPSDKDFRRRELRTLLNNWPGEVDKARKWASSAPRSSSVSKFITRTWAEAQRNARGDEA